MRGAPGGRFGTETGETMTPHRLSAHSDLACAVLGCWPGPRRLVGERRRNSRRRRATRRSPVPDFPRPDRPGIEPIPARRRANPLQRIDSRRRLRPADHPHVRDARPGELSQPQQSGPPPGSPQAVCMTFPRCARTPRRARCSHPGGRRAQGRRARRSARCSRASRLKEAQDAQVPGDQPDALRRAARRPSPSIKANHAKTIQIRNQVCSAAPVAAPAGPSFSDALGGPIIADDTSAKQPGRGTFDTLTGNALSR